MTVALSVVPSTQSAAEPGDGTPVREARLLEAARAGDRDAFGVLATIHAQAVYRTALAALRDPDEAEDAAQDAFLVAWRQLPRFRQESSLRTWLLTIAWRKALDRRRRWRLRWSRVAVAPGAVRDPVELVESPVADPERRAVAADLLRQAQVEIERLSPKLRDTLLLASTGTHTYDEIATLLGIPIGTVKWRVAESRRILERRLSGIRKENHDL